MKKLLTILFTFIALSVSAQNTHKQSNANTVEQFQGAVETKVGLINAHFSDTTEANLSWIKTKPFAQIVTGDGVTWLRNGTATKWIGTGSASINISSDSTSLIICNGSGTCDTIPVVTVAPITNFTILNDTTIEVCGINSCDTIYTLPINYNQNVVNSVSVVNGVSVDSVFYFINGVKYLAGTITHSKTDSTTIKKLNDSTYVGLYWIKGIPYQKGDTIKIHSTTIDSINVSILNGGKIDTSHLPVSKLYIQQAGAGETHIVRAADDTTLSVATLKNTDDITPVKNSDSSVSFNFTHPHYTKDQVDSIKATITGSGLNIYNTDSSLTENRNVNLNTHKLSFTNGYVNIGDTTSDGHGLKVDVPTEFNIGSDLAGDIFYRDSLGTFSRLAPPTGFSKPVLGFGSGYPKWQEDSTGGGQSVSIQTVASGSTVTVSNTTTWLIVNPSSTLSSLTITLPASPTNGQLVDISFGGTITTANAAVVTSLLVVANTGQGLIGTGTYGQVVTEDHIAYRFNSSLSKWFRN